jgi:hypothetical protein
MEKKEGKKISSGKTGMSKADLEEALLNNFVNLQKVLTNLSIKFDELSDNISKLLQIFEISAKSFAEKYTGEGGGADPEMLNKLDSLLDQNKTIAKGIMLMEEKIRQKAPVQTDLKSNAQMQSDFPEMKEDTASSFEGMIRSKSII